MDIGQAIRIEARLAAAIARRAPVRPPTLAKGLRLIAPAGHRVEGAVAKAIAAKRARVWESFLRGRVPTLASVRIVVERMRAIALIRATLVARVLGRADPPGYRPPPRIARLMPRRVVTRADEPLPDPLPKPFDYKGPFNPDPLPDTLGEKVAGMWSSIDDLMAGMRNDDLTAGVNPQAPPPVLDAASVKAIRDAEALAEVGIALDFDTWLGAALNDLTVLQMLESYWNGQAATAAARDLFQATLGGKAAGIQGVFDLTDPYMLNFLQRQSGYYIRAIDNATRGQIMSTLWSGYGGLGPQVSSMSIDELARTLHRQMREYANDRPGATGALGISRYRANMIATTETARAETFGQFIAMLKTGAKQKIWMITSGACIRCMGNNSMGAIPIFDQFPSGHLAPPGHPICRCSLASAVPSTFNPNDWAASPDQAWFDDLLARPDLEQWPNVDLGNAGYDWGKGAPPPLPRMPGLGLIDADYIPQELLDVLTPNAINRVGQQLADEADVAAMQKGLSSLASLMDMIQGRE